MKGIGRRLVRLLQPVVAVVAVVLVSAVPSTAAAETPGTDDPSTTYLGGIYTWVSSPQTLYQCAQTFCNQGQAYPGNDLEALCSVYSGGQYWNLVYNASNNHVGFIQNSRLAGPKYDGGSSTDCATASFGGAEFAYQSSETLYQCPAYYCNQGSVRSGDWVKYWGWVTNYSGFWDLYYNTANGHVGFIPG